MKVTHKLTDELNGIINVTVETEDYKDDVEKNLKAKKKAAQMPGFRQGKVPMKLIKKMYGQSVIADEVNGMLWQRIQNYIDENDLKILGSPLPKEDQDVPEFDPHNYPEMNFEYEFGLAPEVDLKISEKDKFTQYKVKIDDKLVNQYVEDLQRRLGSMKEADKAEENDMLNGEFVELDKDGNPKEGGIKNTSSISLEFLDDKKIIKELTGKKAGDTFKVDPDKVSKGTPDKAAMLDISKEEAEKLNSEFQYTVNKVYRLTPQEVNQEFFDKAFGEGEVKSEEEMKEKLIETLTSIFERDSNNLLQKHIREELLERHKVNLPDEFLKRWILKTDENKTSMEEIEAEYDQISEQTRWDLITTKLIKKYDLEVQKEEVTDFAKQMVKNQLMQYGMNDADDQMIDQMTAKFLENQDQIRQIYDNIYSQKLFEKFKEIFKIKDKEVTFDEFVKKATGKAPKKGIMDNLQNMFN